LEAITQKSAQMTKSVQFGREMTEIFPHDRGNFQSRDGFGHVIIKKSNSFSVSDTLVQKMSGHISICPGLDRLLSLWTYLDIFIMSGQSGHLWTKKFEMSGQNKSLDNSGQSANIRTYFRTVRKCPDIRTYSKGSGEQQSSHNDTGTVHDAAE
jgi:hypothetical protein